MSDSDKTNELDNYGVWVKKPPRTVSSEETSSDNFDIASDLPDFSSLDVIENTSFDTGDTSLSADELSAIASTSEITQDETPAAGSSETEEISLDEFIEGGIFEGDDGGSAASEASEKAAGTDSASTDSFESDSFDTTEISDSSDVVSNSVSISEDSPLDIDLSFDDSPVEETSGFTSSDSGSFSTTESVSSSDGTESIDLSDFGFDINAPEGGNSAETVSETQSESSDSENVDLSEFGFDIDAPEGGSGETPAAEESSSSDSSETESVDLSDFGFDINAPEGGAQEEASEPEVTETASGSDGGMEEISLDSFGFDINAEEGESSVSADSDETAPVSESAPVSGSDAFETGEIDDISLDGSSESSGEVIDLDSLSLDPSSDETPSLELPETDGINMTVTADDDMEISQTSSSGSEPAQNFTADDDDFDLDSIMDSIEDENGDKVSLNSPDDLIKDVENVSTEISTEEIKEEPIQDLNFSETSSQEIPDSFEEETASLFGDSENSDDTLVEDNIVEQDEPVFEETSVDISEIESFTAEELNADQQEALPEEPEADNPFTLPSDDAFALPETGEENNNFADITDNSEMSDSIIEEAADSGADLGFTSEAETSADFSTAEVSETEVSEEIQDNGEISSITAGKDEEIASATNSILSQIVSELASLKNEISGLKNEFEEIKSKEIPAKTEDSGFFSGNEEDDTIALSVDEIDNILNTVEIVDEQNSFEDATSNEAAETFEGNELEEPVIDSSVEITSEEDETESSDEEILLPKVDDILVESGSSDFMEETEDKTAEEDLSIGDFSFENDRPEEYQPEAILPDETSESLISSSSLDEPFEFGSDTVAEESEENASEFVSQEETEVSEEDSIAISNDELENLLAPDPSINDSLTDSNLNYLTADKEIGSEAKNDESNSSSIPGNLQKEIKSVLSYMDQLLENLPEEKIAEFAQSEQFETYKKLFKELGLDN